MLESGLYEELINNGLEKELKDKDRNQKHTEKVADKDVSEALSRYLTNVIREGLECFGEKKLDLKLKVANEIISLVEKETGLKPKDRDVPSPEILYAYIDDITDDRYVGLDNAGSIVRPLTSLSESSLFTGAKNDPQMFEELKREIVSSDSIDMLVSFIKWSGLLEIIDELEEFTNKGGELRVISTSYMGATDPKAIEKLSSLKNTKIKISYDTKITRLHAKAYIFHRNTGFSTAYIGSSNLSKAAMSSGLEWNLKITQKDLAEVFNKIRLTFESYWNAEEFELYSTESKNILESAIMSERHKSNENSREIYTMDVRPYSYQNEILEKLEAERVIHNNYRNLVVAATGTGKTVIAALDYRNYRKKNPHSSRLLFVAHRKEILEQSLSTFRQVLKDSNFGDLLVGNSTPSSLDHLFVSIQSLNSRELIERMKSDFYDYIVVDEFHHAAATSYQDLLNYYKPEILLGLTATPERMDGRDILSYFNNRISAELRLPEAIERKLLCPFQYFGVTDDVDLSRLRWTRGSYDRNELSNIYCANTEAAKKRADLIIASVLKYTADINSIKGLGFCVSIAHAKFMAEHFNTSGLPSLALTADDNNEIRGDAKHRLESGEVKFIFVVDLYNEGVDIPSVNTVLFLRPTESLTVFLQQLGRGLRLCDDKDYLTVLDFIGQANKKYNFVEKFNAISRSNGKSFKESLKESFIPAPRGCYIHLEKIAAKYIQETIEASYSGQNGIIKLIKSFEDDTGLSLTLKNFLDYYHFNPKYIYRTNNSFSRLMVTAGKKQDYNEPLKEKASGALYRLSTINSKELISFILNLIEKKNINWEKLSEKDELMLKMLYVTIYHMNTTNFRSDKVRSSFDIIFNSPVFLSEIKELLEYKKSRIDFIEMPVDLGFVSPLALHCTYSRSQILVALGCDSQATNSVSGVQINEEKNIDILFITLTKTEKNFSPSTMYKDYSINDTLFHWQSQGTESSTGKAGTRYINQAKLGNKVLLFVRENNEDEYGKGEAFTFLGKADFVSYEGEKPMNIIWKLEKPIPAAFIKKTNTLLAM